MPRAGTILFVVYATHAVAFEKALLFRGLLGPVAGSFLTDSPLVSTVNTTFKRNVVMWEHLRSEFSSQIICEANTLVEVVDTRGWAFAAGDAYTSLTFLGLSSKVSAKQRSSLGAGYEMHSIWNFFYRAEDLKSHVSVSWNAPIWHDLPFTPGYDPVRYPIGYPIHSPYKQIAHERSSTKVLNFTLVASLVVLVAIHRLSSRVRRTMHALLV
jgi:hypothetical protein